MNEAIKLAIEKACENGYMVRMSRTSNSRYPVKRIFEDGNFPGIIWCKFEIIPEDIKGRFQEEITLTTNDVFTDPKFWESLGRALGWAENVCDTCGESKRLYQQAGSTKHECIDCQDWGGVRVIYTWLYHSLRYFELKLTGGDEEKFWKELLK